MGGKRAQRKGAAVDQLDSSDDADSVSSTSTAMSDLTVANVGETEKVNSLDFTLEKCLDALYEKRGSTREKALSTLIDAFEGHILLTFVENKFITLLHQYISSVKRGSTKEACLASRAIGLLALTVGFGDNAHEIMEEAVPPLSQALKSGSESLKKSHVLHCLAIITFVGANDLEEKEKSMKIMWDMIHPKAGSNVATTNKLASAVLAAAISAWSFILTTFSGWRLNHNNWKESISFLSTLLEREDRAVRIAAGEAIALIFEIGKLDTHSKEESDIESSGPEGLKPKGFEYVHSLKGKILTQVRNLSSEAGGKGTAKKDLNNQKDLFQDILTFLETGDCPELSMKISNKGSILTVSSWTQSIQLNFLKHFLGSGFLKHMQENELLHYVFNFTPEKQGKHLVQDKRMFRSPNSILNKERTQIRNKHRMLAQGLLVYETCVLHKIYIDPGHGVSKFWYIENNVISIHV